MSRLCELCGTRMPPGRVRKRVGDHLLCPACAGGRAGGGSVYADASLHQLTPEAKDRIGKVLMEAVKAEKAAAPELAVVRRSGTPAHRWSPDFSDRTLADAQDTFVPRGVPMDEIYGPTDRYNTPLPISIWQRYWAKKQERIDAQQRLWAERGFTGPIHRPIDMIAELKGAPKRVGPNYVEPKLGSKLAHGGVNQPHEHVGNEHPALPELHTADEYAAHLAQHHGYPGYSSGGFGLEFLQNKHTAEHPGGDTSQDYVYSSPNVSEVPHHHAADGGPVPLPNPDHEKVQQHLYVHHGEDLAGSPLAEQHAAHQEMHDELANHEGTAYNPGLGTGHSAGGGDVGHFHPGGAQSPPPLVKAPYQMQGPDHGNNDPLIAPGQMEHHLIHDHGHEVGDVVGKNWHELNELHESGHSPGGLHNPALNPNGFAHSHHSSGGAAPGTPAGIPFKPEWPKVGDPNDAEDPHHATRQHLIEHHGWGTGAAGIAPAAGLVQMHDKEHAAFDNGAIPGGYQGILNHGYRPHDHDSDVPHPATWLKEPEPEKPKDVGPYVGPPGSYTYPSHMVEHHGWSPEEVAAADYGQLTNAHGVEHATHEKGTPSLGFEPHTHADKYKPPPAPAVPVEMPHQDSLSQDMYDWKSHLQTYHGVPKAHTQNLTTPDFLALHEALHANTAPEDHRVPHFHGPKPPPPLQTGNPGAMSHEELHQHITDWHPQLTIPDGASHHDLLTLHNSDHTYGLPYEPATNGPSKVYVHSHPSTLGINTAKFDEHDPAQEAEVHPVHESLEDHNQHLVEHHGWPADKPFTDNYWALKAHQGLHAGKLSNWATVHGKPHAHENEMLHPDQLLKPGAEPPQGWKSIGDFISHAENIHSISAQNEPGTALASHDTVHQNGGGYGPTHVHVGDQTVLPAASGMSSGELFNHIGSHQLGHKYQDENGDYWTLHDHTHEENQAKHDAAHAAAEAAGTPLDHVHHEHVNLLLAYPKAKHDKFLTPQPAADAVKMHLYDDHGHDADSLEGMSDEAAKALHAAAHENDDVDHEHPPSAAENRMPLPGHEGSPNVQAHLKTHHGVANAENMNFGEAMMAHHAEHADGADGDSFLIPHHHAPAADYHPAYYPGPDAPDGHLPYQPINGGSASSLKSHVLYGHEHYTSFDGEDMYGLSPEQVEAEHAKLHDSATANVDHDEADHQHHTPSFNSYQQHLIDDHGESPANMVLGEDEAASQTNHANAHSSGLADSVSHYHDENGTMIGLPSATPTAPHTHFSGDDWEHPSSTLTQEQKAQHLIDKHGADPEGMDTLSHHQLNAIHKGLGHEPDAAPAPTVLPKPKPVAPPKHWWDGGRQEPESLPGTSLPQTTSKEDAINHLIQHHPEVTGEDYENSPFKQSGYLKAWHDALHHNSHYPSPADGHDHEAGHDAQAQIEPHLHVPGGINPHLVAHGAPQSWVNNATTAEKHALHLQLHENDGDEEMKGADHSHNAKGESVEPTKYLPNPMHPSGEFEGHYFHGTDARFDGPPLRAGHPDNPGSGNHGGSCYDVFIGGHFSTVHERSQRFGQRLMHVKLKARNPIVYDRGGLSGDSREEDPGTGMAHDAYRRVIAMGDYEKLGHEEPHGPDVLPSGTAPREVDGHYIDGGGQPYTNKSWGEVKARRLRRYFYNHGNHKYWQSLEKDGYDPNVVLIRNHVDWPNGGYDALVNEPDAVDIVHDHCNHPQRSSCGHHHPASFHGSERIDSDGSWWNRTVGNLTDHAPHPSAFGAKVYDGQIRHAKEGPQPSGEWGTVDAGHLSPRTLPPGGGPTTAEYGATSNSHGSGDYDDDDDDDDDDDPHVHCSFCGDGGYESDGYHKTSEHECSDCGEYGHDSEYHDDDDDDDESDGCGYGGCQSPYGSHEEDDHDNPYPHACDKCGADEDGNIDTPIDTDGDCMMCYKHGQSGIKDHWGDACPQKDKKYCDECQDWVGHHAQSAEAHPYCDLCDKNTNHDEDDAEHHPWCDFCQTNTVDGHTTQGHAAHWGEKHGENLAEDFCPHCWQYDKGNQDKHDDFDSKMGLNQKKEHLLTQHGMNTDTPDLANASHNVLNKLHEELPKSTKCVNCHGELPQNAQFQGLGSATPGQGGLFTGTPQYHQFGGDVPGLAPVPNGTPDPKDLMGVKSDFTHASVAGKKAHLGGDHGVMTMNVDDPAVLAQMHEQAHANGANHTHESVDIGPGGYIPTPHYHPGSMENSIEATKAHLKEIHGLSQTQVNQLNYVGSHHDKLHNYPQDYDPPKYGHHHDPVKGEQDAQAAAKAATSVQPNGDLVDEPTPSLPYAPLPTGEVPTLKHLHEVHGHSSEETYGMSPDQLGQLHLQNHFGDAADADHQHEDQTAPEAPKGDVPLPYQLWGSGNKATHLIEHHGQTKSSVSGLHDLQLNNLHAYEHGYNDPQHQHDQPPAASNHNLHHHDSDYSLGSSYLPIPPGSADTAEHLAGHHGLTAQQVGALSKSQLEQLHGAHHDGDLTNVHFPEDDHDYPTPESEPSLPSPQGSDETYGHLLDHHDPADGELDGLNAAALDGWHQDDHDGYHKPGHTHHIKQHHPNDSLGKESSMRRLAHDSGDGQTIFHCPFCGSGQVIARSDNSTECEFCHQAFTVQVQPQFSAFPQTIDGQPVDVPGMPGQIDSPSGAPAPGADPDAPVDPSQVGQDGSVPPGEDDGASGGDDASGGGFTGKPGADNQPPWLKSSTLRTASGHELPAEDYLAHVAIRHLKMDPSRVREIRVGR